MSSFRIRPVFSQELSLAPAEVQRRIRRGVEEGEGRFEIKEHAGFLCFRIHPDDRHFWSPRLNLSIDERADGGTIVHGIYGPNADVWGMFLYSYLIVGLLALFSGLFGFCQWWLGEYAWGLWIHGGMLLGLLGLYIAAQFGQKLAARQMFQIHLAYEAAVGKIAEIH
jgi:hypothetical protein